MLGTLLRNVLMSAAADRFVDNMVRDRVLEPALGSVVYCDLGLGLVEHSGIYVGHNTIVHLTRHGVVERCTPEQFMEGTPALSIYVSCRGTEPIGSYDAARRAIDYADNVRKRDYSVVFNNCHMFSEFCVTGEQNTSTFITFLKYTCKRALGADTWRVWDQAAYAENAVRQRHAQSEAERLAHAATGAAQSRWDEVIDDMVANVNAIHEELRHHVHNPPCPETDACPHDDAAFDERAAMRQAWIARTEMLLAKLDRARATVALLAEARADCVVQVSVELE